MKKSQPISWGFSMSCENYSLTIAGWALNPDIASSVTVDATSLEFSIDILSYKTILTEKNWEFSGDAISFACPVDPDVVFGMQLVDFNAQAIDHQTLLSWTAQTQDLKGFGIERSADGRQWKKIGYVYNNESNATADFRFIDEQPFSGKNYYRLKVESKNDEFTFSEVKQVYLNTQNEIAVYPNPATDILNITGLAAQDVIYVVDAMGKVITTFTAENGNLSIDISAYPAGVYYLNVQNQQGTKYSILFTKI